MPGSAKLIGLTFALALTACGGLETKSSLVSVGDDKHEVLAAMGAPDDRQLKSDQEAWQYCQTRASATTTTGSSGSPRAELLELPHTRRQGPKPLGSHAWLPCAKLIGSARRMSLLRCEIANHRTAPRPPATDKPCSQFA